MKHATAGTLESNDCLVTVEASDQLEIQIDSTVKDVFGEAIEKVILDVLKKSHIKKIKVSIQDKGALDYTIRARLLTAIYRMEEKND